MDLLFDRFVDYLIALLIPIALKMVIIFICVFLVVGTIIGIAKTIVDQELIKIEAKAIKLEGKIDQKIIEIKGRKFGLPIKKELSKTEQLMLLAIRVPEWDYRMDDNLDGDLDSCGAYQQRVSELYQGYKSFVQSLLPNYDQVFSAGRIDFVNKFKNIQLRDSRIAVTSNYGSRFMYGDNFHYGIDFGYPTNTPVSTPVSGIVEFKGWDEYGGGNTLVIKNEEIKKRFMFAHLEVFQVEKGQEVIAGQQIALSGATGGKSTGSHLHFQIIDGLEGGWNSKTINPEQEPFLLSTQRNIFTALCYNLTQIHLKSGLFDIIALERLKREPATNKWLSKEIKKDNLDSLLSDLCSSQRPVNCNVWIARSKEIMSKYIDIHH
jgi:murein DD-endopeptidase MepM/ murein hydrolase activator NlpD